MKKRLLLGFMAASMAMTGFALTNGEYVYTPQGRFLITGDNLNAGSSFANFNGWTVVSAAADKTLDANFAMNANGYAEGINSVVSLDAATTEGMYYTFKPSSASGTYVVSYKMKGSFAETTRIKTVAVSNNLVKVEGLVSQEYGKATEAAEGEVTDVIANTAEELTENWQTFNYAIVGDGTARTYFISFTGMATDIEIADVQIAAAQQYADLRQRDAWVEKFQAYIGAYAWDEALLEEWGIADMLESLKAIGNESTQDELDALLIDADATLTEFLKENMDDFLAGNNDNYLGIKTTSGNTQKVNNIGDWNCLPAGRGFWSSGAYPDMGHYQKGPGWNYGDVTSAMGVYMQQELSAGSYVFAIEANAAFRENASQSWDNDDAMKPAYAVAYIVKIVDGEATDTLVSVVKGLEPVNFTPFIVGASVDEDGTYEIGLKAYCKEAYQTLALGSVVYVKDASIWGKTESKYSKAQLAYEENVRAQITAGRENLTIAAEYLASADYFWGKADLQACVDSIAPRIAEYETMTQEDIIDTYESYYENTTSNDNGILQYEVYQTATKYIIAANKTFVAVNDTLNSMQTVIDNAKATMALRLYESATGKADLQAAIATAEDVQAKMQAAGYSEENAAAIVAANETLNKAIDAFKNSIPASAIATIVDIDFEKDAKLNAETGLYRIASATDDDIFMEFSNFSTETPAEATTNPPYEKGMWTDGEQLWKGYIRVGNGTGTVEFDPTENGSMGTNILRVNFDFFLQGLSGRDLGVFLYGTPNEDGSANTVAAFFANYYDNQIQDNTFGIVQGNLQYGSGGSWANNAPEGADNPTSSVLPKNSFEFIFDYGEKSMYCTTTSAKGVVTTKKMAFDGTIPYTFILQCNYNNKDRRTWFDNLKIERIAAGPADEFVDGVKEVNTAEQTVAPVKKVLKNGRIVINGKYGLNGMLIK